MLCAGLLLKPLLILAEGNRQVLTSPSSCRPGGVVRVYGNDQTDGTAAGGASADLIPYCCISHAQLSYHGYKDAVKFFVAVPGTALCKLITRPFIMRMTELCFATDFFIFVSLISEMCQCRQGKLLLVYVI